MNTLQYGMPTLIELSSIEKAAVLCRFKKDWEG
jgi:hypothetical protein